jgi:hypothetical protein
MRWLLLGGGWWLLYLGWAQTNKGVDAVLPRGYEDELYCPAGAFCLQKAVLREGYSGPRTHMYHCVPLAAARHHTQNHNNDTTPHTESDTATKKTIRPRGCGDLCDADYKSALLREGWRIAPFCASPPWADLLVGPTYIRS